jgi:hypothetical protein
MTSNMGGVGRSAVVNRVWLLAVVVAVFTTPGLAFSPAARGQAMCAPEHDSFASACFLGTPDAQGVTVRDAINSPGQVRAYRFRVGPESAAAYIYLGDLWYDLAVALWRDAPDQVELQRALLLAESRASERRVVQFVQPLLVVQQLEPGTYTVFVQAGNASSFDPSRGFTLRVALGPPVCDMQQDAAGLYQLALAYQPTQPTQFSLMTFNAFLSPPYSDLFDFDWEIDGQAIPGGPRETLQVAALDLGGVAGNEHRVRVTARGTRAYPDPDPQYRQNPPTLSVACTFQSLW